MQRLSRKTASPVSTRASWSASAAGASGAAWARKMSQTPDSGAAVCAGCARVAATERSGSHRRATCSISGTRAGKSAPSRSNNAASTAPWSSRACTAALAPSIPAAPTRDWMNLWRSACPNSSSKSWTSASVAVMASPLIPARPVEQQYIPGHGSRQRDWTGEGSARNRSIAPGGLPVPQPASIPGPNPRAGGDAPDSILVSRSPRPGIRAGRRSPASGRRSAT